MTTPIADFIESYINSGMSRLHMPGHKGVSLSGAERYDITEIDGADELYEADGIIAESEENASSLFGTAHTFYSTEGSSLTIKAMLMIAMQNREDKFHEPYILAARNVHKTFVFGCALLDIDVEWMYPSVGSSICSCLITAEEIKQYLESCILERGYLPFAVYITSPDYLGNIQSISELSRVCKGYNVPLLVDNAHGAYLKFLSPSLHPIDLGADMCCDSAHKTLPSLTGGAYLHISKSAHDSFKESARNALSLFASTSPSYLILRSLDLVNRYLSDNYSEKLARCVVKIKSLKYELKENDWSLLESEPLKIVLDSTKMKIDGRLLMTELRENGVECEFGSFEHIVMMFSPENSDSDYEKLRKVLIPKGNYEVYEPERYSFVKGVKAMGIREAVLSGYEEISPDAAVGRICAAPVVSCPPAIPIVMSGEIITKESLKLFKMYDIEKVRVVQ